MRCAYLEESGRCALKDQHAECKGCLQFIRVGSPKFLSRWKDPLVVISREREPATSCLRGMLAGRPAFLVAGGPSSNLLPLEDLNKRGVWTLCVNNSAAHPRFRPNAFVCSDPPTKFSHSIWFDPAIMKFIPTPKLGGRRNRLRIKRDGKFIPSPLNSNDCPNVWGFKRMSYLTPDDQFFIADGAMWGNHQSGVEKTGQPKTVCTMLLALRLLYYLGARRIYLVGVDFFMAPDWGYSFNQSRDEGACASNNAQFSVVNGWLCEMVSSGVFVRFGLDVYNCYQSSGLRAFPYVPFSRALQDVRGIVEDTPDTADWYLK